MAVAFPFGGSTVGLPREARVFNRISVWLDECAPDRGAFAHASEWAARLRVPLHAVADPLPDRALRACGVACARKGVAWEAESLDESLADAGGFFADAELSAFGADLPAGLSGRLLRASWRSPGASLMVCPRDGRPTARALVLVPRSGFDGGFLGRAASLCRTLAMPPVVLTADRSERRAEARQEAAREACRARGLDADFDLVAGCDLRTAVARAARARGCSHVVVGRAAPRAWWRWPRRDTAGRLLGLAASLTLVTLPAGQGF
jgi:hypothetical protein